MIPAVRCVTQTEIPDNGTVHATLFQVIPCDPAGFIFKKDRMKIIHGQSVNSVKGFPFTFVSPFRNAFFPFGDLYSVFPRKGPDSVWEGNTVSFHHKTEDIPAHTTAKAMKNGPLRIHRKRRGLLRMKRAQAHEVMTGFFQLHAFRNNVHNIRRIPDRLNDIFRNQKTQTG